MSQWITEEQTPHLRLSAEAEEVLYSGESEFQKIEVFKSKIHRVRVTESNLNYIGSITIDEDLIEAAGIVVGERVYIVNVNNGERFDTYVIKGKRGSGEICLNGPAARKVQKDDIVIIIAYAQMTMEEAKSFQPKIVFPDEQTNLLK